MPELALLQAELSRVTDWIRFSDQKSAFLSVYYTASAGFIVAQRPTIVTRLLGAQGVRFCLEIGLTVCAALLFIFGVYFLLSSVLPRLKNKFTDKSLFYFGSVARLKYADYLKEIEALSENESKKQIIEQIYTNSTIANIKMNHVRYSTMCLCGLLLVLLLLWI